MKGRKLDGAQSVSLPWWSGPYALISWPCPWSTVSHSALTYYRIHRNCTFHGLYAIFPLPFLTFPITILHLYNTSHPDSGSLHPDTFLQNTGNHLQDHTPSQFHNNFNSQIPIHCNAKNVAQLITFLIIKKSIYFYCNSSVTAGCRLDDQGSISWGRISPFNTIFKPGLGPIQSPNQRIMG